MIEEIQNYLYMYHVGNVDETGSTSGTFVILPTYPESVTDRLSASFNSTPALSRSAPIFTYANSGPRTIDVTLSLHRDMMTQLNYNVSNLNVELGDDYIDTMVKQLQAIALPRYAASTKMIDPPMVALRFGNEIYIKGIVNGGIGITYSGPIGYDNKYKLVQIQFTITEVDPYDAETVQIGGSFRGLSRTLERRLYKK